VLNVLEQEVYLTSEFRVTNRSPQVAKDVKVTVITFNINSIRIVEKISLFLHELLTLQEILASV